jgi:hypothetical protein
MQAVVFRGIGAIGLESVPDLAIRRPTDAVVRDVRQGDRAVIRSTVGCGSCSYRRAGCHSRCDRADPAGSAAGVVGPPAVASAVESSDRRQPGWLEVAVAAS